MKAINENTKVTLTVGQLRKLVKEFHQLEKEDTTPIQLGDELEVEITKRIQDAAKKEGMELSDDQTQQAVDGLKELLNNETLRYELARMFARSSLGGAFGSGNFMASMVDKLYGKKKNDVDKSLKDKAKEWLMGDEFEQEVRKKLLTDPAFVIALVKVLLTRGADKKSLAVVCASFMTATIEVSQEEQRQAAE